LRKIKEILRLKWETRLSHRAIGRACKLSSSTVSEYIQRATQAGLSWPLPDGLREEELYGKLFPKSAPVSPSEKPLPDWDEVHRELRKRGVTLKLLWTEYHEQSPTGYGYTLYLFRAVFPFMIKDSHLIASVAPGPSWRLIIYTPLLSSRYCGTSERRF
jgi:hypothetical protein